MKRILALIGLLALTVSGYAQTNNPVPPPTVTNAPPLLSSPLWDIFSNTNLIIGIDGIYDVTDHSGGVGIAAAYKLNEMLAPVARLDYFKGAIWNAQIGLQLQVPVTIAGRLKITPFAFDSIATVLNGHGSHNWEPENVAGIGAAISISKHWVVAGDYERWTGAGFNDNQVRFGGFYKF